jgi:hypothetical protein
MVEEGVYGDNYLEEDNNVLKGHSSVVLCMIKIDKQRVGTGSLDKTI